LPPEWPTQKGEIHPLSLVIPVRQHGMGCVDLRGIETLGTMGGLVPLEEDSPQGNKGVSH